LGDEYQDQAPGHNLGSEEAGVFPETAARRVKRKRSGVSVGLELVAIVLGAVLIALLIQGYAFKPFQIPTESMIPTINVGDRILVNRLAYRFGDIERGDIIVFKSPQDPDTDWVKRVVAVEGDTIEVNNHMVIVNGEALVEDYTAPWLNPNEPIYAEREVPEGKVFVMGDNRDNSDDSRYWGFLDREAVVGKAMIIYWPPSRIGRLH